MREFISHHRIVGVRLQEQICLSNKSGNQIDRELDYPRKQYLIIKLQKIPQVLDW